MYFQDNEVCRQEADGRTLKGETHSRHNNYPQIPRGCLSVALSSGRCDFLGRLWPLRHQRYAGWLPGAETARREQNRCCVGQCGGHLLCRLLRDTVNTHYPDSVLVMDLGRGDCRHQDCQSSFSANRLQTVLLPSHHGQQTDGPSTLPVCSYNVLVHCPPCLCGRCRNLRSRSGRTFHQDRTS